MVLKNNEKIKNKKKQRNFENLLVYVGVGKANRSKVSYEKDV